ncbi:P-loop containing nucleoside triphosphate hydrolase protein [Scheffersomyces coipomensis]|uniref:P-loop containing nucleoside triphosphate hydrolase protein n=1 Tax=Scheffersomyces coipomensis TaxID=1788519 RepID=UPI00315CC360
MYNSRPNAPFKAPRLIRSDNSSSPAAEPVRSSPRPVPIQQSQPEVPQQLKRKTLSNSLKVNEVKKLKLSSSPVPHSSQSSNENYASKDRYTVQWRKRTNKKNKTWDGDGYIVVHQHETSDNSYIINFKNLETNQSIKKSFNNINDIDEFLSSVIVIGQIELEVDYKIKSDAEFKKIIGEEIDNETHSQSPVTMAPVVQSQFKAVKPLIETSKSDTTEKENESIQDLRKPLYDNPKAIALPPPPSLASSEIVEVLIDPHLASKLRPHQVEAVTFLYECLMGFRDYKGTGSLLADEMGLGKTLTTIALIWTLYKQSPFKRQPKPIINKILICCPATLINNWRNEFKKWLGLNKIGILDFNSLNVNNEKEKQNIISFGKFNIYQVLIINYEKVSSHIKELSTVHFDLLVCDEGHKLKNNTGKILKNLKTLNVTKKILLTGTPIQNNLTEFFTIIDFINPGILGEFKSFQRNYLLPIQKSREINCLDPKIKKKGEELSNELIDLTKKFTLRRNQSLLNNYLTIKTDIILYVKPTPSQVKIFKTILNLKNFNQLLFSSENSNNSLALINTFRKICNSPLLLKNDDLFNKLKAENEELSRIKIDKLSGKINILIPLLLEIIKADEKIVLISNFTKTLDLLENEILKALNINFLRLDGSTPKQARNKLINDFNRSANIKVFLLSSKSGGMGINLVGASRLILFDNDWNPSIDLQSMARIHRDGQMKPCFIYRILTTGCIDEKIFQRQIMKNNLSSKFMDDDVKSVNDVFDSEDLRNLFEVDYSTTSNTHDLIECDCTGDGSYQHESDESEVVEESTEGDDDEASDAVRQGSWVSALELHQKLGDNIDVAKKRIIRNSLNQYRHIDPHQKLIEMNDKVLMSILKKIDGYEPGGNQYPLSYIMSKVSESAEDLNTDE